MKNNRGFALLEVLISVLIISFGLLALAKHQANLHANQDTATHRTQAQGLAMQKINEAAAAPTPAAYPGGTDNVVAKSTSYAREWTVAADTMGNADVEVRVSWTNSRGASDYVLVNTVITKDGVVQEAKLVAKPPPPLSGVGVPDPNAPKPTPPWLVGVGPSTGEGDGSGGTTDDGSSDSGTVDTVKYTISGIVELDNNVRSAKFTVNGTGISCTMNTNTPVGYTCTAPSGWTGTISVSITESDPINAVAKPASMAFANLISDKPNQDFLVSKS